MHRQDSINLIARLLDHTALGNSDWAADPFDDDAEVFTDPGRWQREKQQFFLDTPQVLGFAGDVREPGTFFAAECMGVPIVVTRDKDNVLRAFINACRHRGARVAKGCGSRNRLTCSFHGWSYSLDGTLAGRPDDKAFSPAGSGCNLTALPVSDRHGLLVVGLTSRVSQACVDSFLDPISEAFAGFHFGEMKQLDSRRYDVDANWKLVVNLSNESYHFATLHRDSLAPMMTHHTALDIFAPHTRWAFPLRSIEELRGKDVEQWPSTPPCSINHTIFPGTLIGMNPGGESAQIIRAEPAGRPGASTVYYIGGNCREEMREEQLKAYEFGGEIFVKEDLPAAVQCQQGISAGLKTISIGRNEPIVQFWQQQWRDRLEL